MSYPEDRQRDRYGQVGTAAPPAERLPRRMRVRPRRGRWGRRIGVALAILLALLLGLLLFLDTRLQRVDALADYAGRPAATPGADWLIVGSDSREGLSAEQRRELATGQAAGRRTDTMMLLHIPRGGSAGGAAWPSPCWWCSPCCSGWPCGWTCGCSGWTRSATTPTGRRPRQGPTG